MIIVKIYNLNKNLNEIKIKIRNKNKIIDRAITLNDSESYNRYHISKFINVHSIEMFIP